MIGACLLNNQMVGEACAGLLPEHFGTSLLGAAWRLILQWFTTGVFFDDEMLQRELRKQNLTVEFSQISEWERLADPPPRTTAGTAPRKSSNSSSAGRLRSRQLRTLEELTDLTIPIDNIKRRIDRDLQAICECSELPVATALNPEDGSQLLADLMLFLPYLRPDVRGRIPRGGTLDITHAHIRRALRICT